MKLIIYLFIRLTLASLMTMPGLASADIYMLQDNTQQIMLTNLIPDAEYINDESEQNNRGMQRYVLVIDSGFAEMNKAIKPEKIPETSFDRVSNQQITDAVNKAAAQTAIDPALLHAVIRVESNYNPSALSRKGAQGLMQLMPSTAKRFNVHNVYDPTQNILGGAKYLRELHTLFNGNMPLILAAYNAGPMAVTKHGLKIPPYVETQLYVPKVLQLYMQLRTKLGAQTQQNL